MIITDLDGTFMDTHNDINARNAAAIQRAMARGVICCACTARNWSVGRYPIMTAGFSDHAALCNGAAIIDTTTMQFHDVTTIPLASLKQLVQILMADDRVLFSAFLPRRFMAVEGQQTAYMTRLITEWDNSSLHRHERVTLIETPEQLIEACDGEALMMDVHGINQGDTRLPIPQDVMQKLEALPGLTITSAHVGSLQIMKEGVSKRAGAQKLAEIYDIPRENIMCVGDNLNDMGMIQWAGLGVAVGNALPEVKAVADYISCNCQEGAVAQAIEHFIEGK